MFDQSVSAINLWQYDDAGGFVSVLYDTTILANTTTRSDFCYTGGCSSSQEGGIRFLNDVNGDGYPEVILSSGFVDWHNSEVFWSHASGALGNEDSSFTNLPVDLDGDGDLDMITSGAGITKVFFDGDIPAVPTGVLCDWRDNFTYSDSILNHNWSGTNVSADGEFLH